MITVSEAAEKIIKRSRYLYEAISKGIINTSALARYIQPELEEMLGKEVSDAAIIMSLNRLSGKIKPQYVSHDIFKSPPEMIVRSGLTEITIANSENLSQKYSSLLQASESHEKYFFTVTKGIFDTTIIASNDLLDKIKRTLEKETIIAEFRNLSAVTIRLPKESIFTPGIHYFFLKSLAWEGINIVESVSAYLEFTIIFEDKDINKAFSILQSLFTRKV